MTRQPTFAIETERTRFQIWFKWIALLLLAGVCVGAVFGWLWYRAQELPGVVAYLEVNPYPRYPVL